jgi:hypothetical protein
MVMGVRVGGFRATDEVSVVGIGKMMRLGGITVAVLSSL